MVIVPEGEHESVVAVFSGRSIAASAIEELKKAGFDEKRLVIVDREGGLSALKKAVAGLDVSGDRVARLHTEIEAGRTVLLVHVTGEEARMAYSLLENCGAERVRFHRPPDQTTRRAA
jgi:hypothetical protein